MKMIQLIPAVEEWKAMFESERAALAELLPGSILNIQHVGSTAIPGMVAKPIIDIAVAVETFEGAFQCVALLEKHGYSYRGEFGISRRHYFVRGEPHLFHLHMLELTSEEWWRMLAFRDYLRANPEAAGEYAALKINLAQVHADDLNTYTQKKSPFVLRVLRLARQDRRI
jgi:GrpB-like predicted nucleotidyltransferase (UPF0157 family)